MKHYDPDKELHQIRAVLGREYYRLGCEKYLEKTKEEADQAMEEFSLKNKVHSLPTVGPKHRKAA